MYHVLVVEDEQWIRGTLSEKIDGLGAPYKVVAEASNGEEAWQIIEELWPSILIADIRMPKMDGLELVQRIHERALPIVTVLLSGYDNFQYAQRAMKYGVTDYMLKPVSDIELKQALANSIKRLGEMKDNRTFLARIQTFLELLEEQEPSAVLQQLERLVHEILQFGKEHPGASQGLLRVLAGRLEEMSPEFSRGLSPNEGKSVNSTFLQEPETEIQRRLNLRMLTWLQSRSDGGAVKMSIRRAYEYMKANYMHELTVGDVARHAGLSSSHFSMLIKKHTGLPFVHTLQQIRLQQAKQLMLESDLKMFEVAEMVGFNSLPHFIKLFKQDTGFTPGEYRKGLGL